eukprot:scaffold1194_cov369-Prasinococcus_capsulatus_cf.AAC.7
MSRRSHCSAFRALAALTYKAFSCNPPRRAPSAATRALRLRSGHRAPPKAPPPDVERRLRRRRAVPRQRAPLPRRCCCSRGR